MEFQFGPWEGLLAGERQKEYYPALVRRVEEAYAQGEAGGTPVYPPREDLFTALRLTPPEKVKCVIVGQDPYHEVGQAHGLAFSVRPGVPVPRSLKNIYKELQSDLGCPIPQGGCLEGWAREGVLLLNDVLTVPEGQAAGHSKFGWQHLTDGVLRAVLTLPQPVAFLLWGKPAQKKAAMVTPAPNRLVLCSAHPSPLSASRGFFGSRPFSRVNEFLIAQGSRPIRWQLDN